MFAQINIPFKTSNPCIGRLWSLPIVLTNHLYHCVGQPSAPLCWPIVHWSIFPFLQSIPSKSVKLTRSMPKSHLCAQNQPAHKLNLQKIRRVSAHEMNAQLQPRKIYSKDISSVSPKRAEISNIPSLTSQNTSSFGVIKPDWSKSDPNIPDWRDKAKNWWHYPSQRYRDSHCTKLVQNRK